LPSEQQPQQPDHYASVAQPDPQYASWKGKAVDTPHYANVDVVD